MYLSGGVPGLAWNGSFLVTVCLVSLGQDIGGLYKSLQDVSSRGHAFKSPAFLIHENWFCTVVGQHNV